MEWNTRVLRSNRGSGPTSRRQILSRKNSLILIRGFKGLRREDNKYHTHITGLCCVFAQKRQVISIYLPYVFCELKFLPLHNRRKLVLIVGELLFNPRINR